MIPKIIHHYWTSRNPFGEKYHAWRCSWMEKNPDYTCMFWDWNNMPYDRMYRDSRRIMRSDGTYIMKTDVFRWELLRLYGGIVVDGDVECRKNFDPLLNTESFCAKSWLTNTHGNAVIGGEPGLPLWDLILHSTCMAILENWAMANSRQVYHCGSLIHAPLLAGCRTILPREFFYPFSWEAVMNNDRSILDKPYPNAYAVHWWSGMHGDGWCRTLEHDPPPTPPFPSEEE